MTTTPLPRKADIGMINPTEHEFSAFVFKIQANMNKHTETVSHLCVSALANSMQIWKYVMCRAIR